MTKRCSKCNQEKSISLFGRNAASSDGLLGRCRDCELTHRAEYQKTNRKRLNERQLVYNRKNKIKVNAQQNARRLGLNAEQVEQMRILQNNKCAICSIVFVEPLKTIGSRGPQKHRFQIDHDHKTGQVRALLCGPCNSGIGYLKDSSLRCFLAASYLQKFGS